MKLLGNPKLAAASNEVFINQLAWSLDGRLACALSDGSISVTQPTADMTALVGHTAVEPDHCQISALQWARPAGRVQDSLVYVKPGVVYVDFVPVLLPTIPSWSGATSISPCCGAFYSEVTDSVVVTLSDGSFYVIVGLSSNEPRLDMEESERITQFSRRVEVDLEKTTSSSTKVRANSQDCFRIYGAVDVDPVVGVAWHYQSVYFVFKQHLQILIESRSTGERRQSHCITKWSRRNASL
jgi:hypothetical protein